jgi:hypothetical protein
MAGPPAPALPPPSDLDARLQRLLQQTAGGVDFSSRHAARAAVRRRLGMLYRRRRVRQALGSSTLAAGMAIGGVQLQHGSHTGSTAEPAAPATPARDTAPGRDRPPGTTATSDPTPAGEGTPPPAPAAPHSWSWDPGEGIDRVAADPGVLYADGRFHVYTTSTNHCVNGACQEYRVPRFTTPDLARAGRLDGDAMPARPGWVAPDDRAIWAPAVARIGERYVLYFAATSGRPQDTGMKCLGAAVSSAPEGPFDPLPGPLVCTPGYWNIDPYPVADGDAWHLLWRQDDSANVTGRIVAARLRPDGLGLTGSANPPVTTLLVGEFPWEEGHPHGTPGIGPIENPAMTRHPATGDWLLTWSANRWETQDYATGLATCAGPLGPCQRISRASPWLRTSPGPGITTTARLGGAGGLSFAIGPDGQLYAVFHAYHGSGQAPSALRVAWACRVEAPTAPGRGYRLAEIARNRSAGSAVSGT